MKHNSVIAQARREQLDAELAKISHVQSSVPKNGWIAEIRKALLMSARQLSKRMGSSSSLAAALERSERNKTITLKTLERAAEALNCELHYYLVPRTSLKKILSERASKVLQKEDALVEHSMQLEKQGTQRDFSQTVDDAMERALLIINRDKRLWDEE